MNKFFRFFKSKRFLLHLGAVVLIWIVIIVAESIYLKSSTNFGEKVEVPTFYKIHIDDLDALVEGTGVTYKIQDSVYLDNWPKGTVCWQHPMPTDSSGMYVKPGREILLSVVPLHPQLIRMPKVVHMSQRMAESSLAALGIRTKITYQPDPEGKGVVIRQIMNGKELPEGTMIPKGTRIDLVVAQGGGGVGGAVILPNLIGLTILEANARLTNMSLSLKVECATCGPDDLDNAIIEEQIPMAGEGVTVVSGAVITVKATTGG
jgi:beta-lactam-binding protein with PASTA domain